MEAIKGASVGRREAERRIDEVRAIVAKMIRTEVKPSAHHELDDLIQDGMVGVFTHIDKWNPEISKFSNYVWLTARSYIFGHVLARDQYACHKINLMTLSLDAPYAKSNIPYSRDLMLYEIIPSDYDLEEAAGNSVDAQRALNLLGDVKDKRIQEIVRQRYTGEERTQREIARELGITHQRVCQLERAGLNHMRKRLMGK